MPWRPALSRGGSKALTVALGVLAAAYAADARAQTPSSNPFEPSFTDPNNAQRFSKPPEGTTRASQPVLTPPIGASIGETGFDSTGSVTKKRKARKAAGTPYPVPRAGAVVLRGPPQQASGQTTAPQIAARAAYANVYKPLDAPLRRPLPANVDPYEPTGIRLGDFLLRPTIEVGYGTDSNPNRTPTGPRSNFALVASEAQIKSQWLVHELGATLRGAYVSYNEASSLDRPAGDGKVFGRYDATRDLRFEGEGRFIVGTDNPGSPNLQAGLAKLPIFTTWGATGGVAQRFNRLDLAVKAGYDRTTFQNSELTDGTSVSNQDRDYSQYRIQGRISYEFSPGFKPFVELDADKRVHEACLCDSVDRSSQALTPKAGITFELLRYLTGEVAAGYTSRDYVSPTLQPLQGFVLDASLIWVASGLTTVTFTATSRAEETTVTGVSGIFRRDAGVTVDHAFRRWLIGSVKFGYGQDEYVGSERVDDRMSLGTMITYKFNHELSLKGEYRHDRMRSNAPNVSYDADIFLIGLKAQR